MLRALTELCGGREVLAEARVRLGRAPASVLAALDDLLAIADRLAARYPDLPLYFDLGELRGYNYHTGVVFAVFVPGSVSRSPRADATMTSAPTLPGTPGHRFLHGFEDPGHTGASGGRIAVWRDLDARQR